MSAHPRTSVGRAVQALGLAAALGATVAGCRGETRSENVPDIPVYPGARLTESSSVPDRDPIDTYTVANTLEATVLDWYRERMPSLGWTPATDETETVVLYRNAEGCYGFVMAAQAPNGRDVMLQLSQQRPGSVCIPYTPMPPGTE